MANGVPFLQLQPFTYTNTLVLFHSCASCASLTRELIMLPLPPCHSPTLFFFSNVHIFQMYRWTGHISRHTVGAAPLSSVLVTVHNKHTARCNRLAGCSTRPAHRGASYHYCQHSNTQRPRHLKLLGCLQSQLLKNIESGKYIDIGDLLPEALHPRTNSQFLSRLIGLWPNPPTRPW